MFESLQMAPPDAILGLTEAFLRDPRANKINLSVGVFKDEKGQTPTLNSIKEAERRLVQADPSRSYLPIEGLADYTAAVQQLLFEASHEIVTSGRAVTLQTPGGTAALRVAADLVKKLAPAARIWISGPTWPNHPSIFSAAGLDVQTYPYFDSRTNGLASDSLLDALRSIPEGDVVCLHGCCHNPTGVDPSPEQWEEIGRVLGERKLVPLVDLAYQGLGDGLREDVQGLLTLCRACPEVLICSSFSKNFGLYGERVGALTIVAADRQAAETALSHAKICVRVNYSNPPAHGARLVATILRDEKLRILWEAELTQMRDRINGMRELFTDTMQAKQNQRDFSFIKHQRGMFSFSGLTPLQVDRLRSEYAIYIVGNGRLNVAGMTHDNMDRLCEAVVAVL